MSEKKKYSIPRAEKVEFDYTESVEACSPGCMNTGHWWHQPPQPPQPPKKQSQDDPNGQFFKCVSPDYHGC